MTISKTRISDSLRNLLLMFDQVRQGPPTDLVEFVHSQPSIRHLPSPWLTWTLICIVLYRQRRLWVQRELLPALTAKVPMFLGALDKPTTVTGLVPGHAGWQFTLDGADSELTVTNLLSGEEIVTKVGGNGEPTLSYIALLRYLSQQAVDATGPCAQRLRELFPSGDSVEFGITHLKDAGLLSPKDGLNVGTFSVMSLSDEVLEHVESIEAFAEAWNERPNRVWLSTLVRDWPKASELASELGDERVAAAARQRAEQVVLEPLPNLTGAFDGREGSHVLGVLNPLAIVADLASDDLPRYTRQALSCLNDSTNEALRLVLETDDPSYCPDVYQLVTGALSGNLDDFGRIAKRSLAYLAKHKYRIKGVVDVLAENEATLSEAVLLSVEHAPQWVSELLSAGLGSINEKTVRDCAAMLAALDIRESKRLCLTAIQDPGNSWAMVHCRLALCAMSRRKSSMPLLESIRGLQNPEGSELIVFDQWLSAQPDGVIQSLADLFCGTYETLAPQVLPHRDNVLKAALAT